MTVTEHREKLQEQLTQVRHRFQDGKAFLRQLQNQIGQLEGAIAMCDTLLRDEPPVAVPSPAANGADPAEERI